jgi:hypothetical protein
VSRPDGEVATELATLGLKLDRDQLRSLSTVLLPGETITDGVAGLTDGYGNGGIFLTSLRAISVDMGRCSSVYWRDVVNVQFAAKPRMSIAVVGFGNAGLATQSFEYSSFLWGRRAQLKPDDFQAFCKRVQSKVSVVKTARTAASSR